MVAYYVAHLYPNAEKPSLCLGLYLHVPKLKLRLCPITLPGITLIWHKIIRYSQQTVDQRPARLAQPFYQRQLWQRSLEKVPAGRDVLYHSDMVTLTALLSQHIGETVAYTSTKAGFMISAPPSSLSASLLVPPPPPSHPWERLSVCVTVCVCMSLRDNYWDVLL